MLLRCDNESRVTLYVPLLQPSYLTVFDNQFNRYQSPARHCYLGSTFDIHHPVPKPSLHCEFQRMITVHLRMNAYAFALTLKCLAYGIYTMKQSHDICMCNMLKCIAFQEFHWSLNDIKVLAGSRKFCQSRCLKFETECSCSLWVNQSRAYARLVRTRESRASVMHSEGFWF